MMLEVHQLIKTFQDGDQTVDVLCGIDCVLEEGSSIVFYGRSGSGKSTLLHCMAGLLPPTAGDVLWYGQSLSTLCMHNLYRDALGFVFQNPFLLSDFSVLENVAMSGRLAGWSRKISEQKAKEMLGRLGLSHRGDFKVASLSGGERQRVSVARALLTQPKCIFVDEPTAHLDQAHAHDLIEYMEALSREDGISFIIATHDPMFHHRFDGQKTLVQGQLTEESPHVE